MKLPNMEVIQLKDIKGVDKVAHINPPMSELEFTALLLDIRSNGQLLPIIICRGLIIDGRSRFEALKEIDPCSTIKVVKLPRNTSLNVKKGFVMQLENRRHKTITQRVCQAMLLWNSKDKPEGVTQKEFIAQQGVSQGNFTSAQWIYKNNPQLITELMLGNSYKLDNHKTTDSITAILKHLKGKQKDMTIKPSDEPYKGLEGYSKDINESVNYHINALLRDISKMSIPKEDESGAIKDIAVQMYKMFLEASNNRKDT